tara:strand:- start:192 stop:500 length:309 start_codon:yes stop_codon:yes gene_type:complete
MFLGFKIWRVQGRSMAPVIPPKSFILANKWLTFLPIKEGQKLVLNHPRYGIIVKTVAIVDAYGLIWSKGENSESLSVEELGPIDKQNVLGRVIGIFKQKESN